MTTGGGTLGRAVLELEADLGGLKRDFNTAERLAKERAKAISRSFRSVGIKLLAAGAGITAVFGFAVKSAANFEQTMANVLSVSGATEEEFQALNNIARDLGRTTAFTAVQAAEGLFFLSKAGLEARESIAALPDTLNLATAGQLELGDAANIVTNVMSGYRIEADQLASVVDVLTTGFTSANTDLVQLGDAFKLGGPVAKAAGLTFAETAATLALLGNSAFQGTLGGTALRGAINHMLNPTTKAASVLARLGVEATDSTGELLPLHEILAQFEKTGLSAGDAMLIFGQRAGPGMLSLIGQGSETLRELTHEMENSAEVTAEIVRIQLDTFHGQMLLLKSAFEGVSIEIGKIFIPIIRSVAKVITPILQAFGTWTEQNPLLAKVIFIVVGAMGILSIAIGAMLILISLMIPALIVLQGTFLATWAAALLPILPVIAAIAALALIGVVLWKNWDTIKQKAIQIWGAIKDTIKKNWDIILAILFPGVGIAVLIARRWGAIKNVITGILSKITSVVIDFAATLKEILFGLLGVKFFSDLFDNIFGGFLGLKNRLSGALRRVGGGTGGANGEGEGDGRAWWEGTLPVLAWEDFIKPVIWEDFIKGFLWKEIIKPVTNFLWKEIIKPVTSFLWKEIIKPVTSFLWKEIIKPVTSFLWKEIIEPVTSFLWKEIIKGFLWETFIKGFLWETFIKGFLWETFIKGFLWETFIKGFLWETFIEGFLWDTVIKDFLWSTVIKDFLWSTVIKDFLWSTVIKDFLWSTVIKDFLWSTVIKDFLWSTFIKPVTSFLWKEIIKPVTSFLWKEIIKPVTSFLWKEIIKPVTSFLWKEIIKPVTSFLWKEIIKPVIWEDFIKGFLWSTFIKGFLWSTFIKNLVWSDFIKSLTEKIPLEKLDPRKPENWNPLSEVDWGRLDPRKPENWNPLSEVDWGRLDPRKPENWIPSRDTGGIVTSPQLAALAMNSRPEAIIPLDRLHEFIGNGGGGLTVNVHVSGDVNGVEKLREIIRQGILDGDRRGLEHAF